MGERWSSVACCSVENQTTWRKQFGDEGCYCVKSVTMVSQKGWMGGSERAAQKNERAAQKNECAAQKNAPELHSQAHRGQPAAASPC